MQCKQDLNSKICPCTFSCSKKGICCDCVNYHRKLGELPACYFPADIERSGDRSIETYVRLHRL